MKKVLSILISGSIILASCGTQPKVEDSKVTATTTAGTTAAVNTSTKAIGPVTVPFTLPNKTTSTKSMEVNVGLFDVSITLPAMLYEGQDKEKYLKDLKAEGKVREAAFNDDGSLTIKMSKADHQKMLEESKKQILEFFNDINVNKKYPSIQKATHTDNFSEIIFEVNKAEYEKGFESIATITTGMMAMMYQVVSGVKQDQVNVKVIVKDKDTKQIINETTYPDKKN